MEEGKHTEVASTQKLAKRLTYKQLMSQITNPPKTTSDTTSETTPSTDSFYRRGLGGGNFSKLDRI